MQREQEAVIFDVRFVSVSCKRYLPVAAFEAAATAAAAASAADQIVGPTMTAPVMSNDAAAGVIVIFGRPSSATVQPQQMGVL